MHRFLRLHELRIKWIWSLENLGKFLTSFYNALAMLNILLFGTISGFCRSSHIYICSTYVRTYMCINICTFVCMCLVYAYIYMYVHVFPVSSSITNATATLDTPNEYRTLHSVTVTCTINPDSAANMCEVMATANGHATLTSNDYVRMYICIYIHTYILMYVFDYLRAYLNNAKLQLDSTAGTVLAVPAFINFN